MLIRLLGLLLGCVARQSDGTIWTLCQNLRNWEVTCSAFTTVWLKDGEIFKIEDSLWGMQGGGGGCARNRLFSDAEGPVAIGAVQAARDLRGVACSHCLAQAAHFHAARRPAAAQQ